MFAVLDAQCRLQHFRVNCLSYVNFCCLRAISVNSTLDADITFLLSVNNFISRTTGDLFSKIY